DQARKGGATEKTVEPIRKKFSTMEIEGSRAERSRLRKKRIRKTIFTLLIFTGGTFFGSVKLRDYNQGILDNSVALFLEQKSDSDWKVVTSQLGKLLPEPWGPQEHVALGNITQGMMGRKDDQENEERVLLRELCQNCPPSLAGVKEHAMGILQSEAKDRFWDGAEPEKLAPKVSDGTLKLNIQFDSFQSCAVNGKMVEAEPNGEDNATIIDLSPWKNEPGELRLEFVDEAGFVIAGKYFVKWDNIPLALEQPKISEPIFPDTDFEIRIKAQGKTLVDTGGIRIEGGTKTDTKRESGELLLTVQARELQPSETEATVRLFGKVEDSAGNISEEFSWSWEIIDKPLYQAGEFAKKGDYPEALEALKDWQSKELIPVKVRNQIYSISDKWSQQINEKSKSASLDDYFELRQQIESIQGALPAILEVVPGAEDLSIQLADQSHNLAIKNAEVRFGSTVSKWMESWKPPDPASNTSLPVSLKDFKIPGDTFWAPIKLADPKARLLPVELIHKQTGLPFQLVPEGTLRDGERHAILSPFYMAKTEVPADIFNGGEANSAANKITWAESDKWCKEKGLALPSESQWLFAAMGDTQGKKHPWGSFEEIEYANLKAPAGETSTLNQLDSHQKNASWCGVLNMVGHVEEWVRDGKVARSERALELLDGTRDPEYFVSGQSKGRIALGGSFQDELNVLKELRQYYLLDKSESYIGFRPIAQVDLRGPSLARGETISVNGEHPAGDSVETDALTFGEEVRVAPGGPNFQLSKVKDGIYKLRFIVPDFEEEEPKPESLEVVFFDTFKNASTFQLEISTWSIDARCEKWKREWDSSVRKSNQVVPFEKAHKGWLKLVKEDLEKEYIDQPNYDKTLKWAQEKYDARLREIKEDLKRKDEEEIQKDTKEQNEEKWGPKAADWLARETKKQDFPVDDDFRSGFSKINNVTVPRNLDGTGGFILRRVKHEKSGLKFIWIPKSSDRGGFYISETEVSWKAYGESGSFSNGPKRPNWRHDENHPVVNISQGNAKKWCDRMGLNLPSQAEWNFSASGPKGKPNKPQTGSVNIEALRGQDYPFSYTCPVTNPGFECWAGGLNWFGNVAELLHPDSKQVAVGYSWKNKSLQNVTEPAKSANHVGFRPIAHPRP
ncbi:MAG: SUMF1/EgtB/PvdO family nonheme iron enzyme, partial [Planctomycetota bacterium]|nr:SUMF1/EgtB/PvdO family nonheme iron enzyme [Planctomycetota bacterium]